MTTSTLGNNLRVEHLRPIRTGRTPWLRTVLTLQGSDRAGARAEARAYRVRERAISRASGSQYDELLAISRCG